MSGPTAPLTRTNSARGIAAALVLLPVALALTKCTQVVHSTVESTPTGTRMTLPAAWIATAIGSIAAAAAALAVLLSLARPGTWAPRPRSALIAAVVVALALFLDVITSGVRCVWRVAESREGPGGRTFVILEWPFWDKSHRELGVESGRTSFSTCYDILSPSESGVAMSLIVRPATMADDRRMMWFGRNGTVVATDHGFCWAAWDGTQHRAATVAELVRMSPFVLLDSTSEGRESDVEAIERQFALAARSEGFSVTDLRAAAHPIDSGPESATEVDVIVPTETSLLAALDDDNPWVRRTSRRIVAAGGAHVYPEATKRLASTPK